MLNLVFGRNISNKTEYLRNLAAEQIKSGKDGFIFIVPEQFSYETEKAILEKVGAKDALCVEVVSLSRLAELVLEEKGLFNSEKQQVDDGVKMMTMSLALEALSDRLDVFKKYITRPALIENLVSFATELKQCSVTVDMLENYASNSEESSLKRKIEELTLIILLYNAMLDKDYYDNDNSLDVLCELFNTYKFFENKTVIIDGFTRFTKQESKVIEKAIVQSDDVYIAFNTDKNSFNDDFSVFENVNRQINRLKETAAKCGVKIAKPVTVDDCPDEIDKNLLRLEKNIFTLEKESFEDEIPDSITLLSAKNKAEECEFVAQNIKRLMREENVRCRDIIVFERSKDSYDRELASSFKKYGIPFYEDKRQPVDGQPLVVLLKSLFDIACNGVSTQSILRYLKSGLAGFTPEETARLENYAYVWRITPSQWREDFTENPRGFGAELNDFDKLKLERLNELRKRAVAPVLAFKRDFSQSQSEQKTAVLYNFLINNGIRERVKEIAQKLFKSGNRALCEEQETVWSLVMDMLDKLYVVSKQTNLTEKRYLELFEILLSKSDFGTLPRGLDEVTIGAADRTRTALKKYVFVVGANSGVFPLNPSTRGLLNDKDRIALRESGVELAETAEYKQTEERFTAYCTVTSATKKLFVTYCESDYNGESQSPSVIAEEIKEIFPCVRELHYGQISPEDKIESDYSAFEVFAQNYRYNNTVSSTLERYFSDNGLFKGKVESLKTAVKKKRFLIEDKKNAVDLFGVDINMSASKIQSYNECPFKYFCRYGIKIEPLKEAEVDPLLSGSIIHEIFEVVLRQHNIKELEAMTDDELNGKISEILDSFLNEKMGGGQNKTKRFLQQYYSIKQQSFNILKRLIEEFKISEFVPTDFELRIRNDSEIQPYVLALSDGGSIRITGSVDRVDTLGRDGKNYLRVVDYKTGGKTFRLGDVLEGLSTQMLIYLFAIAKNGKEKYGEIVPCGVLYMSAKPEVATLDRNAGAAEIESMQRQKNKMSGIVLNDINIAQAMEKDLMGYYIPAKIRKKDGELSGNLISSEELKRLNKKIDKIIVNTGDSIHNGKIEARPVDPSKCDNCDYKCICHFEDGDEIREIRKLSHSEALAELMKDGENDGQG